MPTHRIGVVFVPLQWLEDFEPFKLISNFFFGVADDVVRADKGGFDSRLRFRRSGGLGRR